MILQEKDVHHFMKSIHDAGCHISLIDISTPLPYIGQSLALDTACIRLLCAYQRNIFLTGKAGVGKTSFVKALACKLHQSRHPLLQRQMVFEVNIGSALAGSALRGEFEKRIHYLFSHVGQYENVILFFDEAHSMANTGSEGGISMMDLMKPLLLNQQIRVILATTSDEQSYLSHDGAFSRRFHHINLEEPSIEIKQAALRLHRDYLKKYHALDKDISLDFF